MPEAIFFFSIYHLCFFRLFSYSEEWYYLKQHHQQQQLQQQHQQTDITENVTSDSQRNFLELVTSAIKRLLNYMDITQEDSSTHRLYDAEIIDLTPEVSFIVICPSAEFSCSVPGQREILLQRGDLLSLPIQVYEIIHMKTYQTGFIQKFSKLSCLLELDAATANQVHREAFSNIELAQAKERLATLNDLQMKLNNTWRCARWLMDVITFARDRSIYGISVKCILEKETSTKSTDVNSSKKLGLLLEIPATKENSSNKATKGRGSWPGPTSNNTSTTNNIEGSLYNEFSKSEQHLSRDNHSPFLSVAESRNSDTFNCSIVTSSPDYYYTNNELSKSEQQLSKNLYYSIVENSTNDRSYSRSELHLNLKDSVSKYLDVTEPIKRSRGKKNNNTSTNNNKDRLIPSKSEDTLYSIPSCNTSSDSTKLSNISYRSAASADTSPNLDMRPVVTIIDGSLLSLTGSSDSESGPLSSSTPNRLIKQKIPTSKSMTNVKMDFVKSNLNQKSITKYDVKSSNISRNNLFDDINIRTTKYTNVLNQPLVESNLSKSLTNIKNVVDGDVKSQKKSMAYLKPYNKTDFSEVPSTSSNSNNNNNNNNKDNNTSLQPGILQVYAAYETGLASGTSLKLHVTPKTTAKEVVDLVVTQLNMAVALKGKNGPIYPVEKLRNFCLVAVIGARERCLRDDFKPLQLQNPWKKGRLYVRQKQDVLAALEHSTKHSAII